MTTSHLLAKERTVTGKKVKQLRAQGYIPGILYGQGMDPQNIQFQERALERVLQSAGTTNLISLQIGQKKEKYSALVRDIQLDPIRQKVQHVDLWWVALDEKVTVETSISLVGEAPIGCFVVQGMNSIEIECLPDDLISVIEVDINKLSSPGDTITVRDLPTSDSVTILADADEVVAHIQAHSKEEEPEPEDADLSAFGVTPPLVGSEETD